MSADTLVSIIFRGNHFSGFSEIVIIDDGSSSSFYNFFRGFLGSLKSRKKEFDGYIGECFYKDGKCPCEREEKYSPSFSVEGRRRLRKHSAEPYRDVLLTNVSLSLCYKNRKKDIDFIILEAYPNKGAGTARNLGIGFCSGKIIRFCDSDDFFFSPGKKTAGSKNILQGYYPMQTEEYYLFNNKIIRLNKKHFKKNGDIFTESIRQNRITLSSFSLLKGQADFLRRFYGEDLFSDSLVMEDYYFFLKLTVLFPVSLLPEKFSVKRGYSTVQSLTKKHTNFEFFRIRGLTDFFFICMGHIISGFARGNETGYPSLPHITGKTEKGFPDSVFWEQLFMRIRENKNIFMEEMVRKTLIWIKGVNKRGYNNSTRKNIIKIVLFFELLFEL